MAEFYTPPQGLGQMQVKDFGANFVAGAHAGQQQRMLQMQENEQLAKLQQSQALNQLKFKAASGDQGSVAILSKLDPEYGQKLQEYQNKKAVYYGSQAKSIANLPLGMRNDSYANLYEKAKQDGEDVSMFPLPTGEWSDVKQSALEYIANSAIEPEKQIQLQQKEKEFSQKQLESERDFGIKQKEFGLKQSEEARRQKEFPTDLAYKEAQIRNLDREGKLKEKELAGTKPLSGEAAKLVTIGQGGSSAVNDLRNLLKKEDINKLSAASSLSPNILKGESTQKFEVLRTDLADQIGRLRSGGAITKDEEARFTKLVPKFGDSKSTIEYKLKRLDGIFGGLQEKVTGRSSNSETGKPAEDPLGLF